MHTIRRYMVLCTLQSKGSNTFGNAALEKYFGEFLNVTKAYLTACG